MNSPASQPAPRQGFIRIAQRPLVSSLVKEAKRVGYEVVFNGGKTVANSFSLEVFDNSPEAVTPRALVFKAVQVRPGLWAVSYSLAYWDEPAPVLPATPLNFAKHINTHPANIPPV